LLRNGEAVGNYWAPIYKGMDTSGNPIYEDIDGGGVDINSIGDRRIVGNDYPDFEMGWQNSLSYKKFFFTFSFRAVVGQSLLNWDRLSYENLRPLASGFNILSSTLDHPEYKSEIAYDSRFVDKASYAKLDNLVFGYDFKLGPNQLKLYVSGNNLLTMTKFKGNDPEHIIPGFNTDTEKFGGDNLTYPYSRTFLLGIKFNF
ncbi:MAG: TonB-dependent receptor, partial [Bacteroidales bacterium]